MLGQEIWTIYFRHPKDFINNKIENDNARVLLEAQVGASKAEEYAEDNNNSYVDGHRDWLLSFVDNRIKLPEKMCDPSKATAVRHLLDITVSIR